MKKMNKFLKSFLLISLVSILNFNSIILANQINTIPELNFNVKLTSEKDFFTYIPFPNEYHDPARDTKPNDYEIIFYFGDPTCAVVNIKNFNKTYSMENFKIYTKIDGYSKIIKIGNLEPNNGNCRQPYFSSYLNKGEAYATWIRNGKEFRSETLKIDKEDVHK